MIGWSLERAERAHLLERFPLAYPDVVADHVTLSAHVAGNAPLPSEDSGEIVGEIDGGNGIQATTVRIGGKTTRPDGGTYHVTCSLDRSKGRKPVESNDVLARLGWRDLPEPVAITLKPVRFPL